MIEFRIYAQINNPIDTNHKIRVNAHILPIYQWEIVDY